MTYHDNEGPVEIVIDARGRAEEEVSRELQLRILAARWQKAAKLFASLIRFSDHDLDLADATLRMSETDWRMLAQVAGTREPSLNTREIVHGLCVLAQRGVL